MVPLFFDPTPIPVKQYAERMGKSPETLILLHLNGQFPCLEKIGRDWYVLPVKVVKLSLDGDEAGQSVEGDLGRSAGEEESLLQQDQRRGRGKAKNRRHAEGGGPTHPLDW